MSSPATARWSSTVDEVDPDVDARSSQMPEIPGITE